MVEYKYGLRSVHLLYSSILLLSREREKETKKEQKKMILCLIRERGEAV